MKKNEEYYIVELNYGEDDDFKREDRLFKVFDIMAQDSRFEKIYDDGYKFDDYSSEGPDEDDWLNGFSGRFGVELSDLIDFVESCEYLEDPNEDLIVYEGITLTRVYDVYSLLWEN